MLSRGKAHPSGRPCSQRDTRRLHYLQYIIIILIFSHIFITIFGCNFITTFHLSYRSLYHHQHCLHFHNYLISILYVFYEALRRIYRFQRSINSPQTVPIISHYNCSETFSCHFIIFSDGGGMGRRGFYQIYFPSFCGDAILDLMLTVALQHIKRKQDFSQLINKRY